MRVALILVIVCGVFDLVVCAVLLALVWIEHRRVRRAATATGELIPAATGQFGCLIAVGLLGFVLLYGAAWLLLRE